MDREQTQKQLLKGLTDRALEVLRDRLAEEKPELQALKQITGLLKDLRELGDGREETTLTVVFTGEGETLSE